MCSSLDLNQSCRTEIGPGEFFPSSPDNLNRLSDRLRKTSCFDRRFASVLASVAAPHIRLNHADLFRGKLEDLHKFIAHAKWTLSPGPHGQLSIIPLGHGCSRLER